MTIKRTPVNAAIFLATAALLFFGCKKSLNLTQNKSQPNQQGVRIFVGDYISIRSIKRIENDQKTPVFSGYLGTGDQFFLDPGQYQLLTKLEFSASEGTGLNTTSTVEIKTSAIDSLIINLESSKSYEVFNKFISRTKWVPEIQRLEKPAPSQ